MQIADRCVATFHYTLTDDTGAALDSSRDREPLSYLHGSGQIVAGLERALAGRQAGDQLQVVVAPVDGYGEHQEELVQTLSRRTFGGGAELTVGTRFRADTNMGQMTMVVTKIDGDQVTVDANHPLAGTTLHFDVEVMGVRDASAEELLHGHVHGAGGQSHGHPAK
ncbi:MAG TPA: peptidylprolyl isomerase [Nevskiaceae bacterium]|nr:peptidylprolyl isomerase [Nevskiaceae bacterium]